MWCRRRDALASAVLLFGLAGAAFAASTWHTSQKVTKDSGPPLKYTLQPAGLTFNWPDDFVSGGDPPIDKDVTKEVLDDCVTQGDSDNEVEVEGGKVKRVKTGKTGNK
jgi:hypothetical protein